MLTAGKNKLGHCLLLPAGTAGITILFVTIKSGEKLQIKISFGRNGSVIMK